MAYYNNSTPDHTSHQIDNESSIAQPDMRQQDLYTAYHPSLGPSQPGDITYDSSPQPDPVRHNSNHPSEDEKQSAISPSTAPEVAQVGFYQPQPGYGNRSLSPTLSQGSTNIGSHLGSPYLGSSIAEGDDKEVTKTFQADVPVHEPNKRKRICGLSPLLFWIFLVLLILLAAGLGAGLGVGLTRNKGHKGTSSASSSTPTSTSTPRPTFTGDPSYSIGGVIDPAFYTTSGAFNGSGIAFAGSALNAQLKGEYTVYYQHHTGQIRYLQKNAETYVGGTASEIVASDAKNATPISVVQYVAGGTGTGYAPVANWHVFYIGNDGHIKQRVWTNESNIWSDGPATAQKLQAFDADSVGLQACWYGNFYGDSALSSFPSDPGQNTTFLSRYGMNLWYASDASTFQQYAIYQDQPEWKFQKEWRGFNGHAGVGCYSWLPGTTTYAMLVNEKDEVEMYWRDTDQTIASTETHPINSWVKADDVTIPGVYPSTSLGFTTFFYAMLSDSTIHGYNISFSSENSTFLPPLGTNDPRSITVSDVGGPVEFLNGTHMTCSALTEPSSGDTVLVVFAQTEGDDITLFKRGIEGGQWTSGKLPVDRD